MGSKTLEGALGFIVGLMVCGILFLIFEIPDYPEGIVSNTLFYIFIFPIIEETFKFIPLKSSSFKNYIIVGLMIGLGFGLLENFIRIYPNQFGLLTNRIGASLIHLDTGLLMGFAVSKKKGWLGWLLAILLHSLFNFWISI